MDALEEEVIRATRGSLASSQRAAALTTPHRFLRAGITSDVMTLWNKSQIDFHNDQAGRYGDAASGAVERMGRTRAEIEELERRNKVLSLQAEIYEKRNEAAAVRRTAAGKLEEKVDGVGKSYSVAADRLARIGGYVGGGPGAQPRMESMTQKIVDNTRRTRELLERGAIHSPVSAWG